MKQCVKCKKTKPLDEFWKHSEGKQGRNPRCAVCTRESNRGIKANSYEKKKKYLLAENERVKQNARWAVWKAVKTGKIKKESCWYCNENEVEAHHLLYEFKLKVTWVCRKHHSLIHQKQKYDKQTPKRLQRDKWLTPRHMRDKIKSSV